MEHWNKRTREEVREIVIGLGYELIDEYMGKNYMGNTYMRRVVIKDKIGYKYDVTLKNLKKHVPDFVSKSNPFVLENISLWLKINNKPFKLREKNIYSGSQEKLLFSCDVCSEIFDLSWDCIYSQGLGCSYCSGRRVSDKNRLSMLYPEISLEWHPNKNGNKTPYDFSYGSGEKVWWLCEDGHEWETKILYRTNGARCPHCFIDSHGENSVKSFLHKYSVVYIPQYRFENCRYKNPLPFDFAIFDSDGSLHCLVEYHGIQHYEPIEFFGGEKAFRELQIRDKIKEDFCKDNNIQLKIIPYWEFDNIEQILAEALSL